MVSTIEIEKKIVVIAPIVLGVVAQYLSYIVGRWVMNGEPIAESATSFFGSMFSLGVLLYQLLPFYVLSLYMSAFVLAATRRNAYLRLGFGVAGILVLYIPIEWNLHGPYQGGGADIGGGMLLMVRPILGVLVLSLGIALGAVINRAWRK